MKIVYENKPRAINNGKKENMEHNGQHCSNTESQRNQI